MDRGTRHGGENAARCRRDRRHGGNGGGAGRVARARRGDLPNRRCGRGRPPRTPAAGAAARARRAPPKCRRRGDATAAGAGTGRVAHGVARRLRTDAQCAAVPRERRAPGRVAGRGGTGRGGRNGAGRERLRSGPATAEGGGGPPSGGDCDGARTARDGLSGAHADGDDHGERRERAGHYHDSARAAGGCRATRGNQFYAGCLDGGGADRAHGAHHGHGGTARGGRGGADGALHRRRPRPGCGRAANFSSAGDQTRGARQGHAGARRERPPRRRVRAGGCAPSRRSPIAGPSLL